MLVELTVFFQTCDPILSKLLPHFLLLKFNDMAALYMLLFLSTLVRAVDDVGDGTVAVNASSSFLLFIVRVLDFSSLTASPTVVN